MEITLTAEQESFLGQLAAAEGRSMGELVQEAVARFTAERQAELIPDDEHDTVLAEFRASLDEADASIDRGEGILVACEADSVALVSDIVERARTRMAAGQPSH
jgi:hypothetical protein